MTIDFQDIFERCMRETAYMGRTEEWTASDEQRATTDERVFSNNYVGHFNCVRIRGSDQSLIFTFIAEGAHRLEAVLSWAMRAQGEYTAQTVSWQMRHRSTATGENTDDGEEEENQALAGLAEDMLTAYALWRWLGDKLPNHAARYFSNWETLTLQMKNTMTELKKPTKNHENTSNYYHPGCGDCPGRD